MSTHWPECATILSVAVSAGTCRSVANSLAASLSSVNMLDCIGKEIAEMSGPKIASMLGDCSTK